MHTEELILKEPTDEGLKVRHGPDYQWRFKDMCAKKIKTDLEMMFKDKDKVERYDFRVVDLPRDMIQQFL